jgi:hypothetical protein
MKRSRSLASLLLTATIAACGGEGEQTAPAVDTQALDTGLFEGWTQIPGDAFSSAPAITSWSSTTVDVFARGFDDAYYRNSWSNPTGWKGWSRVSGGGVFSSRPAVTTYHANTFVLVGKGLDDRTWLGTISRFGGDIDLKPIHGDTFDTAPAVTSTISGNDVHLYVFARKSDRRYYWTRSRVDIPGHLGPWSAWAPLPFGTFQGAPAAANRFGGRDLIVVGRGDDGAYWHSEFNNGTWSDWTPIPNGIFSSDPAVSSWGSGDHVDVWGRGADNFFWVNTFENGQWSGPQQVPSGTFTLEPSAWSPATNRALVVGRGDDERIWINRYEQ